MERKKYEKPTMQIVKLQHQAQLLAGSGFDPLSPFSPGGNPLGL